MTTKSDYLLDYRKSGELGPMDIFTIQVAVDRENSERFNDWLKDKLMWNRREIIIGEGGSCEELDTIPGD